MAILAFFWIYTLILSKRAGASGIMVKKNYFLAFSFFFLMFAFNYLQTELMLADLWTYPRIIPEGFRIMVGFTIQPIDSDVFLFLFFFLGATPLSFAIERYLLLHKKIVLTILAASALVLNVLLAFAFPLNEMMATVVILVDYLAMIATVLTILIIYLRIAIISSGSLRAVGFLMFFGFVLQVASLFLSSANLGSFPLSGAEAAHLISVIGFILIFISIMQMR